MKIFALMLACMMVLLVSAVSYAEEASTDIFAMETPAAAPAQEEEELPEEEEVPEEEAEEEESAEEPETAEEPVPAEEPASAEEPTPADESANAVINEEDLVEIEDDWGYVSRELIEQHTPEMTQEFIHADDPDWVPEGQETAAPAEEPVEEQVQEPQTNEAPVVEEEVPAEVTEETEAPAEENEVTEETEAPAEETTEETEEEPAEETEEEKTEEASKVTVKVTASMRENNLMHLKAEVQDPEGKDYNYQWQVSVDGGENYEDVEDMTEDFLDVELDEENVSNLWRVKVHAV